MLSVSGVIILLSMYAYEGNLEQILWNICVKCFFLRILHQILKLNLCILHTVTVNIFLE